MSYDSLIRVEKARSGEPLRGLFCARFRGRRSVRARAAGWAALSLLLAVSATAGAQEPGAATSPSDRPLKADLAFEAGIATFGFGNSLYTDPRPDPSGDLGSNWQEGYFKPALSAEYALGSGAFYGKASVVGAATFGRRNPSDLIGSNDHSFQVEDLNVGWRSGTAGGRRSDLLDVSVGRTRYTIGEGFLVWDGAGEGGSRGAYWSNARMAWDFAAIAKIRPGDAHSIEGFYLKRNDLPELEADHRLAGLNYDFRPREDTSLGFTYLRAHARPEQAPTRDGMDVIYARATAAMPGARNLGFKGVYAHEQNDDLMQATAWSVLVGYRFAGLPWKPRLSYRYAFFQGDDPATARSEAFDPLFYGFSDFGTWYEGEIAGDYFLTNSNKISDQLLLRLEPGPRWDLGLIGWRFRLDEPGSFAGGVASDKLALEIDIYARWTISAHFALWGVIAQADPQEAVNEAFERTKAFRYGFLYLFYSF